MKPLAFVFLLLAAVVAVLSLLYPTRTAAAGPTFVSGLISTDATWDSGGSPYIVTGDVLVAPGATLSVMAGLEVRFDGYYKITVRGRLVAAGTSSQPVIFTRHAVSNWNTIDIVENNPGPSTFDHVIIEFAAVGISGVYGGSYLEVSNSVIRNNSTGMQLVADVPIRTTIIENNGTGISSNGNNQLYDSIVRNNSVGVYNLRVMEGNDIYGNGTGVAGISEFGVARWNRIAENVGDGIYTDANNPLGNEFSGNVVCNNGGDGIEIRTNWNPIENNLISGNGGAGIRAIRAYPHNNAIVNNGTYDYEMWRIGTDINNNDVTNNWWGTTDRDLIASRIYDFYDDWSLGVADYEPFLTGPPPGAPTSCDAVPVPPNTPIGNNVVVLLKGGLTTVGGLELTFSTVSGSGSTTVTASSSGPPPSTGYRIIGIAGQPTYYDIDTTATYSGPVKVCIKYDDTQVAGQESGLKLKHYVDGAWEDITLPPVDTVNDIICGETTTLSLFAIMAPAVAVGGIAELPEVGGASRQYADASPRSSGRPAGKYAAVGVGLTVGVMALAAGAWYARMRWLPRRA
jgi:hypothetical protein